jgi:hypothetical protein
VTGGKEGNDTAVPFEPFGEQNAAGQCSEGHREARCGPQFAGANADLTRIVLSSPVQLTATEVEAPEFPGFSSNLYAWSGGQLRLVSMMPGAIKGSNRLLLAGGDLSLRSGVYSRHAVSDNGDHVVLEEAARVGEVASGLYLRDVGKGETLRLDVSQGGTAEPGTSTPRYMTASADGSRVFFLDAARLTSDSGATQRCFVEGGTTHCEQRRPDLYECAISEDPVTHKDRCTLADLTPSGAEPACVVMVPGSSEDGTYVYFVAGGALAPGVLGDPRCTVDNTGEEEEARNLYVRHAGQTRLVATLAADDRTDWATPNGLSELSVRVSPSGRWLAFVSSRSLTGYDNRDVRTGLSDQEVYLYDAATRRLACPSCDPTGTRPIGDRLPGQSVAAVVPSWEAVRQRIGGYYQPRYLTDNGRLYFDSRGALVPSDVNENWDVYQYEPESVPVGPHACSSTSGSGAQVFKPRAPYEVEGRPGEEGPGCVALISSGTSGGPSSFLDASATAGADSEGNEGGGDVFFLTNAQLSTQDTDTAPDVYDSHECTAASPCVAVPVKPRPCDTEGSCRAAPSPEPGVFGAPASETSSGPGNVPPASTPAPKKATKCKKGFVKKHSKCVKKPKPKKHKAKRATNDPRPSR